MAWSLISSARGTATEKVSDNAISLSPNAAVAVDDVLVVFIATDNSSTTNGTDNGEVSSVTDSVAGNPNAYSKARERTATQGAANDGAMASIWYCKVAGRIETTDSITVNFASNRTAKAVSLAVVRPALGATISVEGGNHQTSADGTAVSVALSGLTSGEYLWLGMSGVEGPAGDVITGDPDYTDVTRAGTTGGAAASNITNNPEVRIFTGSSDTFNQTLDVSRGFVALLVALKEAATAAVPPAVLAY